MRRHRVPDRLMTGAAAAALCVVAAASEPSERVPLEATGDAGLPVIRVVDSPGPDTLSSTRLPVPSQEIPIGSERIGGEQIALSGYRDGTALLSALTSAVTVRSEGGTFGEVLLRGFGNTPFFRNGLNDSLGQIAPRALVNIERIEVLKGPNAALFGPGEPGGAINFVTKRPLAERAFEASAGHGRFGTSRATIDATGPVAGLRNAQFRLVGLREHGGTFRDFVDEDRSFLAPSIAAQPAQGTDVVAALEYVRDRRLLDTGIAMLPGRASLPADRFLGEPTVGDAAIDALTASLSATLPLGTTWQLGADGYFQHTRIEGHAAEPVDFAGGLLEREAQRRDEENEVLVLQLEASGPRLFAGQRHDLLIGLELTALNERVARDASDTDTDPFAIDPFAPSYGLALPSLAPERRSFEQRRQTSLFFQDLWTLGDRWRLLLGGRFDYIDQSGNDAVAITRFNDARGRFSPRVSVVRGRDTGFIWYASYSESLDPNEGLQPDGSALAPSLGRSVETGVRWVSRSKRLELDLAAFAIRQSGVTVDAPANPGFEIQTGRQENKGLDFSFEASLSDGLHLQVRYNYLDTRITNDPFLPDGTSGLNAPRHQAGLVLSFDRSLGRAGDIRGGLALGYVGSRQASLEPGELTAELDDFVRLDAFVTYTPARWLDLSIRLENVGDARYVAGSQSDALRLSPGSPLDVRGELRVRF